MRSSGTVRVPSKERTYASSASAWRLAALIAAAAEHLAGQTGLERIIFCLFDEKTFNAFAAALAET